MKAAFSVKSMKQTEIDKLNPQYNDYMVLTKENFGKIAFDDPLHAMELQQEVLHPNYRRNIVMIMEKGTDRAVTCIDNMSVLIRKLSGFEWASSETKFIVADKYEGKSIKRVRIVGVITWETQGKEVLKESCGEGEDYIEESVEHIYKGTGSLVYLD